MTTLLENWRSEVYQLLLIGAFTTTAVVLSYDYVVETESANAFFAIIGAGLLLALLVIVPVFLVNQN
jgi:hypothetical protein